jgi:hypothetical protein
MLLQCDKGRQVTLTARVGNTQEPADFGVQVFVLRKGWVFDRNPLGYQVAGGGRSQDGKLTIGLPAEPVGLFLYAKGAACDWEVIDPREANRFDITMLREGRIECTVLRDGKPVANAPAQIINWAAALSLHLPRTDEQGRFDWGGLAPGQWSVSCSGVNVKADVREGETTQVTLNLTQ